MDARRGLCTHQIAIALRGCATPLLKLPPLDVPRLENKRRCVITRERQNLHPVEIEGINRPADRSVRERRVESGHQLDQRRHAGKQFQVRVRSLLLTEQMRILRRLDLFPLGRLLVFEHAQVFLVASPVEAGKADQLRQVDEILDVRQST